MKITKSLGFLVVHVTLTGMFFTMLIFSGDFLTTIGVSIIAAITANITQFVALQVRDNRNKSKDYRWELDPNMTTKLTKNGNEEPEAPGFLKEAGK